MKLRSAFLSKIIVVSTLGGHASPPAMAQNHEPATPQQGWAWDKDNGNQGSTALQRRHFQELEEFAVNNPHRAINKIVNLVNAGVQSTQNGMRNFALSLNYSKDLPVGDTTVLQLGSDSSQKVTLQLTVHESALHNPFFLMDALLEVNSLFNLFEFSVFESYPVYGKKHPHHKNTPPPIVDYHYVSYTLENTLGLPLGPLADSGTQSHVGDQSSRFLSPMEYLEMKANAIAGSPFSQRKLQEIENNTFIRMKKGFDTFSPIRALSPEQKKLALIEYAAAKGVTLPSTASYESLLQKFIDTIDLSNKRKLDFLNASAKKAYQQNVNAYKARNDARDLIDQGPALNDMIMANDREGVAKVMDIMLPWEVMEPTEKVFWKDFIEAIRHPDYTNAQILYRGLDADEKFQAVKDAKGNIISGGLLSKRLTAGSGSHIFKLRGLPQTFETFGTFGAKEKTRVSPLTQPHTVTKMMMNHAEKPNGSPFISLTYSADVAFRFAIGDAIKAETQGELDAKIKASLKKNSSGGLLTVRIDPRRLLVNSVSPFNTELEVLASMFIFPDEIIHMEKGLNVSYQLGNKPISLPVIQYEDYMKRARAAVLQKTGIELPAGEAYRKNGSDFIGGLKKMEQLYKRATINVGNKCEVLFK